MHVATGVCARMQMCWAKEAANLSFDLASRASGNPRRASFRTLRRHRTNMEWRWSFSRYIHPAPLQDRIEHHLHRLRTVERGPAE